MKRSDVPQALGVLDGCYRIVNRTRPNDHQKPIVLSRQNGRGASPGIRDQVRSGGWQRHLGFKRNRSRQRLDRADAQIGRRLVHGDRALLRNAIATRP